MHCPSSSSSLYLISKKSDNCFDSTSILTYLHSVFANAVPPFVMYIRSVCAYLVFSLSKIDFLGR